jgi:MoaA/NifB/PqqE/SkfB family radical SAM enzyme
VFFYFYELEVTQMKIKERIKGFGLNRLLSYMDSNAERNIPKALDWLERFDRTGQNDGIYKAVRRIMADPDNNWHVFLRNIYADLDGGSRRALMRNLVVNASILGNARRFPIKEKENCSIPWAILMDPTSACNLRCTGCWAAEYGGRLSMELELLDRIVTEGKALGTYLYIYSGGEPLLRKSDIITLCEKHSDCMFLAFTNGTLIDAPFAANMRRVRNFIPAISVEGFREASDSRRGAGTYDKAVKAMELLRESRLPFGISVCYTSKNAGEVGSDAFIDAMIEKGAKFCWYFTYVPVGRGAPTDLIASAAQREFMYRQVRRFRNEKPMFILDFWNDGEYVGGCIAGGRSYIHISAGGDVEPCAFVHYSNVNIRDVSLLEALKAPLFAEYMKRQPFSDNPLRPCPLLDNPEKLAEMVRISGAHSTDMMSPEDAGALTAKCMDAAARWEKTADRLWEEATAGAECRGCSRCG